MAYSLHPADEEEDSPAAPPPEPAAEPAPPEAAQLPSIHPSAATPGQDFIDRHGYDPSTFTDAGSRAPFEPVIKALGTERAAAAKTGAAHEAAAAKQARRDENTTAEAYYRTHGIKTYVNANGDQVPELDEAGDPVFHAKKGPVEYDPATGEAFQTNRDERGTRTKDLLDAQAEIGSHKDAPNRLFKQNKQSAWQDLGTIDDNLAHPEARIAQAAAAAKTERDTYLGKQAGQGFKLAGDQLAGEEVAHEQRHQAQQAVLAPVLAQIGAKQHELATAPTGWFGGQTDNARLKKGELAALQAHAATLAAEAPSLKDLVPATAGGDGKMTYAQQFKNRRAGVALERQAFEGMVDAHGGDVSAAEQQFRDDLGRAGGKADEHPAMAHLEAVKNKMGMPTLQEQRDAPRVAVENVLRQLPALAPLFAQRDALMQQGGEQVKAVSDAVLNAGQIISGAVMPQAERAAKMLPAYNAAMEPERQKALADVRQKIDDAKDKAIADAAGLGEKAGNGWRSFRAGLAAIGTKTLNSMFFQDAPEAAYNGQTEEQLQAEEKRLTELNAIGDAPGIDQQLAGIAAARRNRGTILDPQAWQQATLKENLDAYFGVKPALEKTGAAIAGRAVAGIAGYTATGPAAISLMLATAATDGRNEAEAEARAAGETDPQKIRAAGAHGSGESVAWTAVTLPFYIAGGKAATAATKALLPQANALARAGAGFLFAGTANTLASGAVRKVEGTVKGEESHFLPNAAEELWGDWGWAGTHAIHEGRAVKQAHAMLAGSHPAAEHLAGLASDPTLPVQARMRAREQLYNLQDAAVNVLGDGPEREAAAKAVNERRMGDANAAIDALGKNGEPELAGIAPADVKATQDLARGLAKIATGQPYEVLTAEEQARVEEQARDGLPRVKKVKGAMVITQGAIDRLGKLLPDVGLLIRDGEADRREALFRAALQPPKNAKPPVPKKGKAAAATAKPVPATAEAGAFDAATLPLPRALDPREEQHKRMLSGVLKTAGVAPELADRYAHGFVSRDGLDNAAGAGQAILEQFAKHGGRLPGKFAPGSPEALAADTANTGLLGRHRQSARARAHERAAAGAKAMVAEATASLNKQGVKTADAAVQEKMRAAAAILAPAWMRYRTAFGEIHYTLEKTGGGGVSSHGHGKLGVSIGDILAGADHAELKANPRLAIARLNEEFHHSLVRGELPKIAAEMRADPQHAEDMKALMSPEEWARWEKAEPDAQADMLAGKVWEQLPPHAQRLTRAAYLENPMSDPRRKDAVVMGHEWLRMYLQHDGPTGLSEAASPSLLKLLAGIFKRLTRHFTNLRADLAKGQAAEGTLAMVETLRKNAKAAEAKIEADAQRPETYEEGHEQTINADEQPGAATGRAPAPDAGGAHRLPGAGEGGDGAGGDARGAGRAGPKNDLAGGDGAQSGRGEQLGPEAKLRESNPPERVRIGDIETATHDAAGNELPDGPVKNFKAGVSRRTGTLESNKLDGAVYSDLGRPAIVVWQRKDGRKQIITGRHRLEKAESIHGADGTILAHVVQEKDGWTRQRAEQFDAESNIQDGQGTSADYARYFHESKITEARARAEGLIGREKGRVAWAVVQEGGKDLREAFINGRVNQDAAYAIAKNAPGNATLQHIGLNAVLHERASAEEAADMMQVALKLGGGSKGAADLDLFGDNDANLQRVKAMAKLARGMRAQIGRDMADLKDRRKNPERARALVENLDDPAAVTAKFKELEAEQERMEPLNWPKHPDIFEALQKQLDALDSEQPLNARTSNRETRRFRELLAKQGRGELNRWETAELTAMEKRAGQQFIPGFDELREDGTFSLESEAVRSFLAEPPATEQLALFSRRTVEPSELKEVFREMADRPEPVNISGALDIRGTHLFGTGLGIPRAKMPQVPAEHLAEFHDRLRAEGVVIETGTVNSAQLQPSQGEMDGRAIAKFVKGMKREIMEAYPIMVSADDYVVDGHHRWAGWAVLELAGEVGEMPVLRVHLAIKELLTAAVNFMHEKGAVGRGLGDNKVLASRRSAELARDEKMMHGYGTHRTDLPEGGFVVLTGGGLRRKWLETVWGMYVPSYERLGMQFKTPEGLVGEKNLFSVIHNQDGKPVAFSVTKISPWGEKTIATGTDRSKDGVAAWVLDLDRRMRTYGVYSELSGKPREIAERTGLPSVRLTEAEKVLEGKALTPGGDGFEYWRDLTVEGVTEPHLKRIFGLPYLWNQHQPTRESSNALSEPSPARIQLPKSGRNIVRSWEASPEATTTPSRPPTKPLPSSPGTGLAARASRKLADPSQESFDLFAGTPLAGDAPKTENPKSHENRPEKLAQAHRRPSARTAPDAGLDGLFSQLVRQRAPERGAGVAGGGQGELFAPSGQPRVEAGPADFRDGADGGRLGGSDAGDIAGVGGQRGDDGGGNRSGGRDAALGGGDGETGDAGGRGDGRGSDPSLVERPADPAQRNHVILRGTEISPRGLVTKLRANTDAIGLLKKIEGEQRAATPEERAQLVKYSGWGALSQAFDGAKGERIAQGEVATRETTAARYREILARSPESEYYRAEVERQEEAIRELKSWDDKWGDHHRQLKTTLTPDEYRLAQRSTINAHYTAPEVISGMWDIARQLGFKGGNVLEPAAGIGHFFGLMPEDMVNRSRLHAVEMDDLSGRITRLLYPEADVQISPFQTADIADNSIDLSISNVPFANVPVTDSAIAAMDGPRDNLHDYFFAKALTKTRPGGLAIFITSAFTMDKGNMANRKWLAEHADLVTAFRLPNDAFKANAGTDVVTDMIVLRKKDGQPFPHAQEWTTLADSGITGPEGEALRVNEYFAAHPQNILGRLAGDGGMFAGRQGQLEMTVHSDPARPADVALQQAVNDLPRDIAGEGNGAKVRTGEISAAVKMGSIVRGEDGLYRVHGEAVPNAALNNPKVAGRVRRFMEVRDALNRQYELELSPEATDEQIEENRRLLNERYDGFKDAFKDFHERTNKSLFRVDPDYYRLAGAELPEKMTGGIAGMVAAAKELADGTVKKTFVKADVFNRRVLTPRVEPVKAESVEDAFGMSLGWRGRVDTGYMAGLLGQTREQVERGLIEREIAVRDPQTGQVQSREEYLSGNVRKKLAIAQHAGPDYARNVRLLEGAQPAPVPIGEVRAKIGATWIPAAVYENFLAGLGITGAKLEYHTDNAGSRDYWTVDAKKARWSGVRYKDFGTPRMSALELMDALLNFHRVEVKHTDKERAGELDFVATTAAKEAAKKLHEAFIDHIGAYRDMAKSSLNTRAEAHPEDSKLAEEIYAKEVNAFTLRTHDGQHLSFPWASKDFNIFPDKKNTVWRAIQDGFGLIAHGVGGGKTIVGSAIALEMRRLGMARKPMIVVHNATLEQFANTIAEIAPSARVLVGRKDELQGDKRKEFLMRIAAGDWDAVVLAHSTFGRIEDDPAYATKHMRALVDEVMEALREQGYDSVLDAKDDKKKPQSVKAMIKTIETLEAKIAEMAKRKTDTGLLNFQQLGVDALIVDEIHEFKKMPFATKLDVKGIDSGMSQRGYAMLMRARSIQEKMQGKNVFTMTGTPVTNTLGEVWNQVRLVAPHLLKEYGIERFDQFVSKFAEVERTSEETPTGERKEVERLSKVVNLPEWATFFRMAADVKLGDALVTKKRPGIKGGKPQLEAVERTPGVGEWVNYIRKVLDDFSSLKGEDFANNPSLTAVPVQAYMASRAAAIDIRLVEPRAKDEPGSKVNRMLAKAMEIYERSTPYNGAQVIFADSFNQQKVSLFDGVTALANFRPELDPAKEPGATFNLYDDIKAKLIAAGVPEGQIALITDAKYKKPEAREKLFDDVNAGRVRFIVGSTQKLGTGVNMQERMAAGHHLDVPWTPAGLEQRDGRVFRQGNLHADMGLEVELLRYGMKDSLDSALWQKLETKQRFITLALSGKFRGREIEEVDEILSLAEQRAVLSGRYGQEAFELDTRLNELRASRQGHEENTRARHEEIISAQGAIAHAQRQYAQSGPEIARARALGEKVNRDGAQITVAGQTFETKTAMMDAVNAALDAARADALAIGGKGNAPLDTIHVNGTAIRLQPEIFVQETYDADNRPHEVRKADFHLVAPEGGNLDFGRVTSAGTLLARLAELHDTTTAIAGSRRNNLSRLAQMGQMEELGAWPHAGELTAAEARRKELTELMRGEQARQAEPPAEPEATLALFARASIAIPEGIDTESMPPTEPVAASDRPAWVRRLAAWADAMPAMQPLVWGNDFKTSVVSPNPSGGVDGRKPWRVTFFRAQRVSGHEEFPTKAAAAARAYQGGSYNPSMLFARRSPSDDPGQLGFDFKNGNTAADRIKNNFGIVDMLARRFDNIPGADRADVQQQARIALVKAAQSFDPARGHFEPYAVMVIKNKLRDFFDKELNYRRRNVQSLNEPDARLTDGEEDNLASTPDRTQDTARDAANRDGAAVLDTAIRALPDRLQTIIRGVMAGRTLEDIGAHDLNGLSRQGAGKQSLIALRRLRGKLGEMGIHGTDDMMSLNARASRTAGDTTPDFDPYEAIAALQRLAAAETPGARTVGRPDLALGASNPQMMGLDAFRESTAKPQTREQWVRDGEKMLADDRSGVRAAIIERGLGGGTLSPEQTVAAKRLVAEEMRAAFASPDPKLRSEVALLLNAYRESGTTAARGLGARWDEHMTPEDRHREFFAQAIFTPPADVQAKLDAAPDAAARRKILEEDQARVSKIDKELAKMGVSLDDIMQGEVTLRLKAAQFVDNATKAFTAKEREAMRMIQANRKWADIAKHTGLDEAQIKAAEGKLFDTFLQKHLSKFKAGATAANVELEALHARSTASAKAVSDADALAEARRAFAAMGFGRGAAQGQPRVDLKNPVHVVKVARAIKAAGPSNAFDMAYEAWINGILSGPATHFANAAGNAANAAWDFTAQRGMEAIVNALTHRDPHAAQLDEAGEIFRGILPGLARGFRNAAQGWSAEADFFRHDVLGEAIDLSELDDKSGNTKHAIPGRTGKVVRVPGRALMFADAFFKGLTAQMEAGAQAHRIAKGEGLAGDARAARIRELLDTPNSEAWQRAVQKATELTFQEDLKSLEKGGNHLEDLAATIQGARGKNKLLGLVIPFVKTPFNVFRQGVRKSPLGAVSLLARLGRAGLYKIRDGKPIGESYAPPEQVKHLAEQALAWTALAVVWGMTQGDADDDDKRILITGSMPRNETSRGERDLQQRAYGGSYQIRIGGRHGVSLNYGRYEPFATVLGTMTDAIRALKGGTPAAGKMDALWGYFIAQAQSKTFLQGLADLTTAIGDGQGTSDKAARAVMSALVPNLIRQPLRNLDGLLRDSKGGGIEYAMLPTAGHAPEKTDAYGNDVAKAGNKLSRIFLPTGTQPYPELEKADALLLRWNRENPAEKWAPAPLTRQVKMPHGQTRDMTGEEYRAAAQQAGASVRAALSGLTAQQVANPTGGDVKQIRDAFERARHEAREAVKARAPATDFRALMFAP